MLSLINVHLSDRLQLAQYFIVISISFLLCLSVQFLCISLPPYISSFHLLKRMKLAITPLPFDCLCLLFLQSLLKSFTGILSKKEKALKTVNGKRPIRFEIYRCRTGKSPYIQYYDLDTSDTPMVLDAILKIKNTMDPTLTFRRSCREGICGSCSMNIGGQNTLACLCTLPEAVTEDGMIRIYPLPQLPVIKDLVGDLTRFYDHHRFVEPWLHLTPEQEANKTEIYQSEEDRKKLDGLYECIMCACCSTSCPSYWWHGEEDYLGPAAILQAYRWIADSREDMGAKTERYHKLTSAHQMVFACHGILNCTLACPKHLSPARAISNVQELILTNKERLEDIKGDERYALNYFGLKTHILYEDAEKLKEKNGLMGIGH